MFRDDVTLEALNAMSKDTMVQHLSIEYTEIGKDYLAAKMPVDHRTRQPFGLLHGGASVVLAETLGSVAANCCIDTSRAYCVGLEINANHVRNVKEGYVYGVSRPIHVGKSTQIWEVRITNEKDQLVCISRITLAVLEKK